MKTVFTVYTYQTPFGTWVFDDARVKLKAEPFVAGADDIVERLALSAGIRRPGTGFQLVFSSRKFKGYQIKLDWKSGDVFPPDQMPDDHQPQIGAGNTYECSEYGIDGWLCPALYRYFSKAPQHIYAAAMAKEKTTKRKKTHAQKIKINSRKTTAN